jgi:hypothetical protein
LLTKLSNHSFDLAFSATDFTANLLVSYRRLNAKLIRLFFAVDSIPFR